MPVYNFEDNIYVTFVTKNGMIKRTKLNEFKVQRYNKPLTAIKLKEDDKLINTCTTGKNQIFVVTKNGYGLRFYLDEVAPIGTKGAGVKAISLKDDEVVSFALFDDLDEYITIITEKNTGKRVKISDFEVMSRARKGVQIIRDVKTNPYYILNAFIVSNKTNLIIKVNDDFVFIKNTEFPIMDRYSTGSSISKKNIDEIFVETNLLEEQNFSNIEPNEKSDEKRESKPVELEKIDEKMMTIDDFLDDFKINGLD